MSAIRIAHSNNDMKNLKNCVLHGLFLLLYAPFKNVAFPFFNYIRYGIIKFFAKNIRSAYISEGVFIWFPWRVKLGKNSSLNQGVLIDGYGGVEIGSGVRIAPYSVINTADHNFADLSKRIMEQGYICAKVVIEDDVWVGTHVCINKGVTIGKGYVIRSGSVVTKDIPPYSIAVGIPCCVIKKR
ncbi:MAG: acyltransferase [Thermodesulfobacteriota bacterium]|nr:acyltransferase [Thermodesulfobacteriota bacterium]